MPKFVIRSLPVLIAGLAGLIASLCAKHESVQARGSQSSEIPTVAVARATTEDLSHNLVLTAEFKPFQEVDVMAKIAGYIKEINVDVGDHVKQNQLLATLEIPEMADDLRRADASVKRSQAEVQRADDELQRAKSAHDIAHLSYSRLFAVSEKKPGLIAQQDIDDAQSKDLVAEAQVNNSDVERVKTLLVYTRVTAPFAGVVTKRYADTGSMIQAGTASQTQAMPVVRLSENSLLRLILPVPESVVPTVHIGQQVEVRVPTLTRSFPGKVARFSAKLSTATRTMDTEVDVPNSSLILIPGMYAEVNLTLDRRHAVLAIPVMAVDPDGGGSGQSGSRGQATGKVMIVTHNNRVETRTFSLGIETANQVEIRSGLNEGDTVVLSGRSGLQP